jgi:hypothetical protein
VYYYIYDDYLGEKRFEKEVQKVEGRLTDLGIAGKIARLALFRNAESMIRDELRKGIETVVVVGNDETVRKVIDVIAQSGVVFGIIPIGPKNEIARLLGIPQGVAACDVLSARILETIDMGSVNGRRFISGLSIPEFSGEITCDDRYRVYPKEDGALEVWNLYEGSANDQGKISNPCDGKLETIIRTKPSSKLKLFGKKKAYESMIPLESFAIRSSDPMILFADGERMEATRFDVSVEAKVLRAITGRSRLFET